MGRKGQNCVREAKIQSEVRFAENRDKHKGLFLYILTKTKSNVERNCSVCLWHAVKVGKENVEGCKYLQIENSNSESDIYFFTMMNV